MDFRNVPKNCNIYILHIIHIIHTYTVYYETRQSSSIILQIFLRKREACTNSASPIVPLWFWSKKETMCSNLSLRFHKKNRQLHKSQSGVEAAPVSWHSVYQEIFHELKIATVRELQLQHSSVSMLCVLQ